MKYDRRTLEVQLEHVELGTVTRRARKQPAGRHVISAAIICPRPMIAERTTLKTVTLTNGVADLRKEGWARKILFKEVIQGPFSIRVDVSEEMSDSEIDKFMDTAAGLFAKLAQRDAVKIAAGAWTTGLISVPIDYLGKALSLSDKNTPCSIGTGEIDVTIDERWGKGASGKIRIPLCLERDVYQLIRGRRGGEMKTDRKKLLAAGSENGSVEISLQTYD